MKSLIKFALSLAVIAAAACEVQAGFGLLHRGGCSDPCGASACGGVSACGGGCGGGCEQGAGGYASPVDAGCSSCGQNSALAAGAGLGMSASSSAPQGGLVDCGPVASYQVVMEPQYVTETRVQCATEYQDEVRTRTRSVPRQVPVEVQDYRTTTVMVPTVETKSIEYSVLVPVKGEKSVEVTESVPVWTDVVSNYTVRVPTLVDVPEEYTVRVAQLRDETFNYTVYVPQTQSQTRMQTVTNAVPVTKQRTIEVCRPVTHMQAVTKDYGHWEVRVEEVAVVAAPAISNAPAQSMGLGTGGCGVHMGGCGSQVGTCGSCGGGGQVYGTTSNGCRVNSTCRGCGGCGSSICDSGCGADSFGATGGSMAAGNGVSAGAPATQTVSRRVWVPNVVTENVPVVENQSQTEVVSYTAFETQTEQVPYECTYVVYVPEQRSGTRQAVDYVNETRTRTRKVAQYNEETRSRTHRELSYNTQTRTETIPFVSYTTEKKTKEVTYNVNVPQTKTEPFTTTRFDTVVEDVTEEYTVRVPVPTTKEVQVQVCRMVPKLVPVTLYPCSGSAVSSSAFGAGNAGCASCGGIPTLVPAVSSGCTSCGQ